MKARVLAFIQTDIMIAWSCTVLFFLYKHVQTPMLCLNMMRIFDVYFNNLKVSCIPARAHEYVSF